MEDLDIPPKETVVGRPSLGKRSVFVYKVQNRTLADINEELMNILQQMKERGAQQPALEYAIEGVQEAEDTNSLVFLADDATIAQLKDLLSSLDTTTSAKMTYYIYKIQMAPEPQISASLQQMKQRLQASKHPDMDLIKVIDTMEWNEETNSLIFIGSPNSINKLKEILPTFDVTSIKGGPKSTFLIYNPQYRNGEKLYNNLEDTGRNLKDAGLVDSSFLQTLATMKWTPSTNSLLFTGTPQSLDRIQGILTSMDTPTPFTSKTTEVFVYKPQFASPQQIESGLQSLVASLEATNTYADQSLVKAIQSMKWNPDTMSFTVTTDPATVQRLKKSARFFRWTSTAGQAHFLKVFFSISFRMQRANAVIAELKKIAAKIPASNLKNNNFITTINNLEWVRSNNSLLITGSPDAIDQVKTLLADFDISSGAPTGAQSFYIYKPINLPPENILAVLKNLSDDMQASGLEDPDLFQSLSSARYVQSTSSLLFAGSQASLDKIKALIATIDITFPPPQYKRWEMSLFFYKLQTSSPEQFIAL